MKITNFILIFVLIILLSQAYLLFFIYQYFLEKEQLLAYKMPEFSASLHDLPNKKKFVLMTSENDFEIAFVDITIPMEAVYNNEEQLQFTVTSECEDEGGKIVSTNYCGGTVYIIAPLTPPLTEAVITERLGSLYLKGHFLIVQQPGLHQGFTTTVLKEVPTAASQSLESIRKIASINLGNNFILSKHNGYKHLHTSPQ